MATAHMATGLAEAQRRRGAHQLHSFRSGVWTGTPRLLLLVAWPGLAGQDRGAPTIGQQQGFDASRRWQVQTLHATSLPPPA